MTSKDRCITCTHLHTEGVRHYCKDHPNTGKTYPLPNHPTQHGCQFHTSSSSESAPKDEEKVVTKKRTKKAATAKKKTAKKKSKKKG